MGGTAKGSASNLDQIDREHALREHEVNYKYLEVGNETANTTGVAAVKNLFLMHGGALVAMLAFTSNLMGKSESQDIVSALLNPMMYFSVGLALAAGASGGTYLTNYCYLSAAHSQELGWEYPYVYSNTKTKVWNFAGVVFHVLTILAALACLTLFVIGFVEVKRALSPLATDAPESAVSNGAAELDHAGPNLPDEQSAPLPESR